MTDQQIKQAIAALPATKRLIASGIADNLTGRPATFEALTGNLKTPTRDIINKALKAGALKDTGPGKTSKGRWVPAYVETPLYVDCEEFLLNFGNMPTFHQVKILHALSGLVLMTAAEVIEKTGVKNHVFAKACKQMQGLYIFRSKAGKSVLWSIQWEGVTMLKTFMALEKYFEIPA